LFKTTIKGVTRQPQEKRVQNDKKHNLCTTFENLNWNKSLLELTTMQKVRRWQQVTNYTYKQLWQKETTWETYKTTMNKIMQDIIPPQLVIFSLIHPSFFFPSCLPFSFISLLNQLHFHFHKLLSYLLLFIFFMPIICPFLIKFSFIFVELTPFPQLLSWILKRGKKKRKWSMHIFCVLCSHYVVCLFVILPQKISVHNKMRVLHLSRSLTTMIFLEKWGCHIVT